MTLRIEPLTGAPSNQTLRDLSRLRLTVFREWPYLYKGDEASETEYLSTFSETQHGIIVCAYDGDRAVGAATAAPLADHTDEFVPLFESHGYRSSEIFYCGESVLLPDYRGRGIGHAFFDHREAHARDLNAAGADLRYSAFCGVVREPEHPRCPPDYRPLDGFWHKRDYQPVDGMIGHYSWCEIGGKTETAHAMQFWIRPL